MHHQDLQNVVSNRRAAVRTTASSSVRIRKLSEMRREGRTRCREESPLARAPHPLRATDDDRAGAENG